VAKHNSSGWLISLLIVAVVLVSAAVAGSATGWRPFTIQAVAVPTITNPGFEGDFYLSGGVGELVIGDGWNVWYDPSSKHHRPEYKPETVNIGRGRVHSGQNAQKLFTTYSTHDAGLYQIVYGTEPGQWYRFSMWAYQWSSSQDNPDWSEGDGKCSALVGINPWGDTNVMRRTTIWGQEAMQVYDHWTRVEVVAQAWSDRIVVAFRHTCQWPVEHNDGYFDDAHLELASVATGGPTSTPLPTYTPYPTYTPAPTSTPRVEPCPTCEPGASIDYAEIERIVRAVVTQLLAEREPVRWPR